MANIILTFAILGAAFAWYAAGFRVPTRFAPYAGVVRPAVAAAGWVIFVVVVGQAAINVVGAYFSEPGTHFFSPHKNADAYWLMIALQLTVGVLLGGSLIKMARAKSWRARHLALPDA